MKKSIIINITVCLKFRPQNSYCTELNDFSARAFECVLCALTRQVQSKQKLLFYNVFKCASDQQTNHDDASPVFKRKNLKHCIFLSWCNLNQNIAVTQWHHWSARHIPKNRTKIYSLELNQKIIMILREIIILDKKSNWLCLSLYHSLEKKVRRQIGP